MAGSFGYESEHYDISKAIGRILFDQVEESGGETVTAPAPPAARSWETVTARRTHRTRSRRSPRR